MSLHHPQNCFNCREYLEKRSVHYLSRFGVIPTFKAAADAGLVTAVEIGDMKRDIAYHGDPLNIASRIQGLCLDLGKDFLVSKSFVELVADQPEINRCIIGTFLLKGKEKPVEVFSLSYKKFNS